MTDRPTDSAVDDEARAWVVRQASGAFGPEEARTLAAWRDGDPRHAEAETRARALWVGLRVLPAARSRRRRLRALGAAGALAATGAAVALLLSATVERRDLAAPDHRATFALSDGSRVELDRGAAVRVEFRPWGREVVLRAGRAHFTVAHGPRPFTVVTAATRVEDLGTAFTVRAGAARAEVAVTEGRVRVTSRGAALILGAGEAAEVGAAGLALADARRHGALTAWLAGDLSFKGTPLPEVAARLARLHGLRQVEVDARVAGRRVTGRFSAEDLPGLLAALEAGLGVEARVTGSTLRIVPKAP